VVVDTHILADAARAEKKEEQNDAQRLIQDIIRKCPRLVFSEPQRDEAFPFFRKAGFLFPQQTTKFLGDLEKSQKLVRLERYRMRELTSMAEEILVGHMKDDRHLYMAATQYDKVVITQDPHLLANRETLKGATGVSTLSLAEALAAS
jgi:hypothetical protein